MQSSQSEPLEIDLKRRGSTPLLTSKDEVFQIEVVGKLQEVPRDLVLKHYRVEYRGVQEVFSLQFSKNQDVVDLVEYFHDRSSGELLIATTNVVRPVVRMREWLLAGSNDRLPHHGLFMALPGGYIRTSSDQFGIDAAVQHVAEVKLGWNASHRITSQQCGGAYFTDTESSELAYQRSFELVRIGQEKFVSGETFQRHQRSTLIPVSEIINPADGSKIVDLRLLLAAYRLASAQGVAVASPIKLPQATPRLSSAVSVHKIEDLYRQALDSSAPPKVLEEVSTGPGTFLRSEAILVRNVGSCGDVLDEYRVETLRREKTDTMVILPYAIVNGEVVVLVNVGHRLAFSERNAVPHPIYSDISSVSIEGLGHRLSDRQDRNTLGLLATEIAGAQGLVFAHPPTLLAQGFYSPGFDPGASHLLAGLVDIQKSDPSLLAPNSHFVKLSDLLRETREGGRVRSLQLALAAEIMSEALSPGSVPKLGGNLSAADLSLFQSCTNQGLHRIERLFNLAPEVLHAFAATSLGRKILFFAANDLEIAWLQGQSAEARLFFSPAIGAAPLGSLSSANDGAFLAIHDVRHFTMGDFLPVVSTSPAMPFQPTVQSIVKYDFETYRRAILANEAEAVYFSEVTVPRMIGLDLFAKLSAYDENTTSLAAVFATLSLSPSQERALVNEMVIEGKLPLILRNHPQFSQIQEIVRLKCIGYFVRDSANTKLLYDNWVLKPRVAEVAQAFCELAVTNPEEHVRRFAISEQELEAYPHGVNPIRAYLSDVRAQEIRPVAFKLGEIVHLLEGKLSGGDLEQRGSALQNHQEAVHEALTRLKQLKTAYDCIGTLRSQCKTAEQSRENLAILKEVQALRAQSIRSADLFVERIISRTDLLTVEESRELCTRVYPALPIVSFFTTESQLAEIDRLMGEPVMPHRS